MTERYEEFVDGEDLYRILDRDGSPIDGATVPDLDDDDLVGMYRDMRLCRRFDERAISLQRQGRIGTYSSLAGQEGSQIGSMYAIREDDLVSYQYREHGAVVVRDKLGEYLSYWMGHESGNAALADVDIFPLNIGVGAHIPHAVGAAWAFDYRDEDRLVVAHFGDGATSEGDFHEALNVAGVFDLPVVFCCHNNGWAISIPRSRQTASRTLAEKATAYGFDGIRVDGMDPLATYAVVRDAAERAREGETTDEPDEQTRSREPTSPTQSTQSTPQTQTTHQTQPTRPMLIETVEYRYGAHTTADDPSVYREDETVERWKTWDPIDRLESFLIETGRLDEEAIDAIESDVEETVATAVDVAESATADPMEMFSDVAEETPPELLDQAESLDAAIEEFGADAFLREE